MLLQDLSRLALRQELVGQRHGAHSAREAMGRERVISLIRPANTRSIRVAERLGERLEGRTEIFGLEALVYAIDHKTWRAAGGG